MCENGVRNVTDMNFISFEIHQEIVINILKIIRMTYIILLHVF